MPSSPVFSISILAYQNLSLTRKCLESVIAAGGDIELLLTDNGCKDGTSQYFDDFAAKAKVPVSVFHNPTNLGFIEPNRRAFKEARGRYFILLNNDSLVKPHWLDLLAAPFKTDPKCAMTGPAGGCCQLRADFTGEGGPRFEYLEGAMLCMDRAKVAALEPDLFPPELDGAYGEDSYLSLRVREAGYNIHRVAMDFTHYRAATSAMVPQCREWQRKNHEFLQRRFRNYIIGHRFDYPTIIRRAAAWGDVLLTTPVIRALKAARPMSPIWVETNCPEVFNGNPDISHVGRSLPRAVDAVDINLNGISEMRPGVPIIQAYADCAGVTLDGAVTAMYPCQGDVEWAKRTATNGWVAVHPGPTSWKCKNWDAAKWRELIAYIQQVLGRKVVLVGNDAMPPYAADLDLRSKTNVGQLAAILGEVGLFVGVDSFPIHVAQAMRTPVVGLFGITRPELILTDGSTWGAARSDPTHPATGLRHASPGKTHVDHAQNPMDTITVEAVCDEIVATLKMSDELDAIFGKAAV